MKGVYHNRLGSYRLYVCRRDLEAPAWLSLFWASSMPRSQFIDDEGEELRVGRQARDCPRSALRIFAGTDFDDAACARCAPQRTERLSSLCRRQ
jgi:hypothetical protein